MSKITLYTLSTCNTCRMVKEALIHEGVAFDEILCDEDKNSYKCDNFEIEIDCNFYPMAIISKKVERDRGGYFVYVDEKTVIHFCKSYDDIMIKRKINSDYSAICAMNVINFVELIFKNN